MGRGLYKPTLETMQGGACLLYMKYQQIGIPPEEAQFLETRKFQMNEIARLYRIPPHMVGDLDKSSFSNIEQQSLEFVKYTLDPWVIQREQSLQKALLLPQEPGSSDGRLSRQGYPGQESWGMGTGSIKAE